MTIREQIIRERISKIEKRISKITELLEMNPLGEIINIRIEAQELFNKHKGIKERMTPEFTEKLKQLAKKEKKWFKIAEEQRSTGDLIEEKVKLSMELSDLNHDLYSLKR